MPEPQVTVGVTITVRVNVDAGTATPIPEKAYGAIGTKFTWVLDVEDSTGNSDVKAYLALPDHDVLMPDPSTDNEDFQGVVYPFQNSAGVRLKPAFHAVQEGAEETAIISVLFPNSEQQNLPVSSVVIIDM